MLCSKEGVDTVGENLLEFRMNILTFAINMSKYESIRAPKDLFAMQLEPSAGGRQWTFQTGSSGEDEARGLWVDGSDIYLAGRTKGEVVGLVKKIYLWSLVDWLIG